MPALHNDVFDDGLNALTNNTENLHILSLDPGVVWANIAAGLLGTKAAPTISAPADRTAGGREVTLSATTLGQVNTTGTATHFALTDDSADTVLVSGPLDESQVVTAGNTFALPEITIGIPDPVSA
jgi:hypothetical protein